MGGAVRVLVTGSSGQVGSFLVDGLRARALDTLGVDLRPSPWTDRVVDVRHLRSVEGCDAVVHCAAQVSVPASIDDPRLDAAHNVDGTLAVLDLARRADVRRLVFLSSAAVYGDAAAPVREDAPLAPRSPYGASKAAGEAYVGVYRRLYGLDTVVLRPFNIFSPRQDPSSPYSGLISRACAALAAGKVPTVHGDGLQTRDFVHVDDVVQATLRVLDAPAAPGGTFNVGTGRPSAVRDVVRILMDLAGARGQPSMAEARPGDIRHSHADISRLRRLGYEPRTDLRRDLAGVLRASGSAVRAESVMPTARRENA